MQTLMASLLSAAALAALAAPSPARALVAPGRVTISFTSGHREGVDPFSVSGVAVTPDGRIVTTGIDAGARRLLLTRALSSGAPDPTFGRDGVVSLDVPRPKDTYGPFPGAPQIAADGSIFVASQGPTRNILEATQVVVTHVLVNGSPDLDFGSGGSTMPGVENGSIAVTGDGRILVAGFVGQYDAQGIAHPGIDLADTTTAAIARLTPTGALDPTFGTGGIVKLPGNAAGALVGLPDGGAAVATSEGRTEQLIELAADGSVAPGFNDGAPLAVTGGFPDGLLARPDGAVDLLVDNPQLTAAALVRVEPDGTVDPAFGAHAFNVGEATLSAGLAGSDLVSGVTALEPGPGEPFTVTVRRLLADGTADPVYGGTSGRSIALVFGGGYGTPGAIHALPQVDSLDQTGFRGGAVAARPGGGIVIAGAAAVIQYTGEGDGFEHEDVALAAFGADLAPDASFGGPALAPTVTFSLPRQRAATDAATRRRYVLVRLAVSTPGLCQVAIRTRSAVVAKADVPVFSTAGENAHVWLTKSGRALLPRAVNAAVTAQATCEDLLGTRTTAATTGRLR
jgi:uncharacterized delta-60 repeat protein